MTSAFQNMQTLSCQLRYVTSAQAGYASTLTHTDDLGRYVNDVFMHPSLVERHKLIVGDVVTVRTISNDPGFVERCPLKAVDVIREDGAPSSVGHVSTADTPKTQRFDVNSLLLEDTSADTVDLSSVSDDDLIDFALDAVSHQALRASDIAEMFLDDDATEEDIGATQRRIFNLLTAESVPHARLYTRQGQQKASELWFARSLRLLRPATYQEATSSPE